MRGRTCQPIDATELRRYATLAGPNGPAPDAFLFFTSFSRVCGLIPRLARHHDLGTHMPMISLRCGNSQRDIIPAFLLSYHQRKLLRARNLGQRPSQDSVKAMDGTFVAGTSPFLSALRHEAVRCMVAVGSGIGKTSRLKAKAARN